MRCRTPARAVKRVDLPVFGLPIRATVRVEVAAVADIGLNDCSCPSQVPVQISSWLRDDPFRPQFQSAPPRYGERSIDSRESPAQLDHPAAPRPKLAPSNQASVPSLIAEC